MRARRTLTVVGCHAGGEVGNVVVGGVLPPTGATVFEQMEALRADDSLRRLLLREPRGSVAFHANLIVPSTRDDCDAGFIIMEPTEYPAMSGSNTICVATVLLETGMVEMKEPETTLRLEAPAGVVEVSAVCRDGRCESVELTNVAVLRRPARRGARGGRARHDRCRRRFRRHVVRDRRRRGARLRARAVGGARAVARGRGDPRGRARAAPVRAPRERRTSPASASSRSPSRGRESAPSRRTPSSSLREGSTAPPPARDSPRAWPRCTRAGSCIRATR